MPYKHDLIDLLNRKTDAAAARKLNWRGILSVAEHSRILPLLFHCIEERQAELNIPEDVYLRLKRAYELNAARNTLLLEEFSILARAFKDAGISLALLKGAGLLHTIFQDSIAIRKMDDIDILIKEEDVRKAARVLASSGYKLPEAFDLYDAMSGPSKRKSATYFKDTGKAKATALAPVHLHWHIVNISSPFFVLDWSKINMLEIWSASTSLGMDGTGNIFVMSPEHMVLALCEHGMQHGFTRLDLIYDIHSYVTRYRHSLDWHKVASLAKAWELAVPLYAGLYLSHSIFSTYIPEDLFRALRPKGMSSLEKHFVKYVQNKDFPKERRAILLQFAVNRKIADKVKLLFRGLRAYFTKRA